MEKKPDSVEAFIENLKTNKDYQGQVAHLEVIASKQAKFGRLKEPLESLLRERLKTLGIAKLYSHQAKAINLIRQGKNVIVTSGTASGKSLSYNLPVLETILKQPKATALYLFPTKALAQDQLRVLDGFAIPNLKAATYDGDTPRDERAWARRNANLVLTNPDMLSLGFLPLHKTWGNLLLNLTFIVVDEAHTLRGIFGSNVANVLRRLRRVCASYGSRHQFILTSATLANPKELAKNLTGLEFEVIEDDGSSMSQKYFVFWNPPFVDTETKKSLGGRSDLRKSSNSEASYLFVKLAEAGLRNITFSKSRKTAELVYSYGKKQTVPKIASRLSSYRAGYLPKERRAIEKRLFSGKLLGVSSTNALELGVDVGSLDAAVINGFPGTIASTWQQAGRAGRRQSTSAAFLVATQDPLDQYYMKYPADFFGKPHEEAIVNFSNPYLLKRHLVCAAYEEPLSKADKQYFGDGFLSTVKDLATEGKLIQRGNKWFYRGRDFPASNVNIRSVSSSLYLIVEQQTGTLLGTVDEAVAFFHVHPGAIYLHQGDYFRVVDLDLEDKVALVRPSRGDYYTLTRDLTDIWIREELANKKLGQTRIWFGRVEVSTQIFGFQKRRISSGEAIGEEQLDLPPNRFLTEAFWFTIPDKMVAKLRLGKKALAGGIHAIEHTAIGILPFFAMCDRWDIGGVSTTCHEATLKPTIFVYDACPGGAGIAAKGYQLAREHLAKTLRVVADCPCQEGCPSCIQSPKCGNFNEPLDKKAAIKILGEILT